MRTRPADGFITRYSAGCRRYHQLASRRDRSSLGGCKGSIDDFRVEPTTTSRAGLDVLREADACVRDILAEYDTQKKIWQCPVVMLPLKRHGDSTIAIRPVESHDGMTAQYSGLPWPVIERIANAVLQVPGVGACLYDVTNKPRHNRVGITAPYSIQQEYKPTSGLWLKTGGRSADSKVMIWNFAKGGKRMICDRAKRCFGTRSLSPAPMAWRERAIHERAQLLRRQHELLCAWKAQGWEEVEIEPVRIAATRR